MHSLIDAQEPLKVRARHGFRNVMVDKVDPRPVKAVAVVIVFHQQIHMETRTEFLLQGIHNLSRREVLVDKGGRRNPSTLSSFPCLNEFPGQQGSLVHIQNLNQPAPAQ